jgi:hypothetical protein
VNLSIRPRLVASGAVHLTKSRNCSTVSTTQRTPREIGFWLRQMD